MSIIAFVMIGYLIISEYNIYQSREFIKLEIICSNNLRHHF